MSFSLLGGVYDSESEDDENGRRRSGENGASSSGDDSSVEDGDGEDVSQGQQQCAQLPGEGDPWGSQAASAQERERGLPSPLDMFTEVKGPPSFLDPPATRPIPGLPAGREEVPDYGAVEKGERTPLGSSDPPVLEGREKKQLPVGAVIVAQAQTVVSARDWPKVDDEGGGHGEGVTTVESVQPVKNGEAQQGRVYGVLMPTKDGASQLLRICDRCGIPKTFSNSFGGLVCPQCKGRALTAAAVGGGGGGGAAAGSKGAEEADAKEGDGKRKFTVKDREKSKRMRGQSSHASWKSQHPEQECQAQPALTQRIVNHSKEVSNEEFMMDGLKTPDPPSRKRFGAVGESKKTGTQEWRWSPGTPSIGGACSPSISSVGVSEAMTPRVATPSKAMTPRVATPSKAMTPRVATPSNAMTPRVVTPSGLSERKRRSGWCSIGSGAGRDEGSPICLSARKKGRKEGGASVEYHSQDKTQTRSFPIPRNESKMMLPPHSQIDTPYQKSVEGEDPFVKNIGGGELLQQPVTPLMETSSSRSLRRRPVLKSSLVGLTIASPRSAIDSAQTAVGSFWGLTSGTASKKEIKEIEVKADALEEKELDCDATDDDDDDDDCLLVSMDGDIKEEKGLTNDSKRTSLVCEDVVDLRDSSDESDDDMEEAVEVVNDEEKDVVKKMESSAPGFVSEGAEGGVSDRVLKGKGGDMVSAAGKVERGEALRSPRPSWKKGVGRHKGGKGSLIDNHFPPSMPTQRRKINSAAVPSVRQGMITRRTNAMKVMSKKATSNNLLNYYRLSKGGISSAARGKRSDVTKESNALHKYAASVAYGSSTKVKDGTSTSPPTQSEKRNRVPCDATEDSNTLHSHAAPIVYESTTKVKEGTLESRPTASEKHDRVACSPTQLPAVAFSGCEDGSQVQVQTKGNERLPFLHEGNGTVVPSLSQVAALQDLESLCERPARIEERGEDGASRRHVVGYMAKTVDAGNRQPIAARAREGSGCQSALRIPPSPLQRAVGGKAIPLTSVLRSSDRPAKSETVSGTPGRRRVTFDLRHQDDSEAYGIDRVVIGSPMTTTTSSCEVDGTCDTFDCLWTKEPKRIVEFLWQNDPVYRGMLCMGCEHQYTDEFRERYLRALAAESS
ncbi:hypothetical protein CBR_g47116 [Chara braunii]|uniref:Uncharacterized protein n=1 Tax=Chara braunii TaxID=69332 RepID=A0A388M1F5_CHABU|nr:hypothetical protein CBR_g47116 [Chara braunii]|eukprot:GBG88417.1 hypothetical protein CBR_g47116 [Chara braunii]